MLHLGRIVDPNADRFIACLFSLFLSCSGPLILAVIINVFANVCIILDLIRYVCRFIVFVILYVKNGIDETCGGRVAFIRM